MSQSRSKSEKPTAEGISIALQPSGVKDRKHSVSAEHRVGVKRPMGAVGVKHPVGVGVRRWVQVGFSALCVWIGIEFHFFVKYLDSAGAVGSTYRPPGVEGFLPISSLMSFYHLVASGEIHPAHPAGMFILSSIVLMSIVFGKSFCSWACPVGLLSEKLGDLGDWLFGRRLRLPRILDYPLRSLKYLLLGFFVYSIFFLMTPAAIAQFLASPYNQVADVKMYYFFADLSRFSLIVLISLTILSVTVRNFWCRYLCPYGALLGFTSLLSPNKIQRDPDQCTNCGKCAAICPSSIKVNKVKTVLSDECTACMSCVDICPEPLALHMKLVPTRRTISKKTVAAIVVLLFTGITGLAMITGNWHNNLTSDEYLRLHPNIRGYGHPTGSTEIDRLNTEAKSNISNDSSSIIDSVGD